MSDRRSPQNHNPLLLAAATILNLGNYSASYGSLTAAIGPMMWMSMSLIKARRPKLPVVVLTGEVGKDLEARAKTAGAAGFLTKPCQPDALIRTLVKATTR